MTEQQHFITPPPELVQQWAKDRALLGDDTPLHLYIANRAAQYGADQELEACCEYVYKRLKLTTIACIAQELRAARRPKPPSLKEQALNLLDKAEDPSWDINDFSVVRRALEQLPND
jgi:hypothetical protein